MRREPSLGGRGGRGGRGGLLGSAPRGMVCVLGSVGELCYDVEGERGLAGFGLCADFLPWHL